MSTEIVHYGAGETFTKQELLSVLNDRGIPDDVTIQTYSWGDELARFYSITHIVYEPQNNKLVLYTDSGSTDEGSDDDDDSNNSDDNDDSNDNDENDEDNENNN